MLATPKTILTYFAATDRDCDGTTTTIYALSVPREFALANGDDMPKDVWATTFRDRHYFAADEMFVINAADALAAIVAGCAGFYDHGAFKCATVKGIPARF